MDDLPNPAQPDPQDLIAQQQRGTMANALDSLHDSPDEAKRSLDLSEATGVPAPIIQGNLEDFEKQHKAALTASLLNNNRYLRQYLDTEPMASKLSNDDYGQLDTVSEKMQKLGMKSVFQTGLDDFMRGFNVGYDVEGRKEEFGRAMEHPLMRPLLTNPLTGPVLSAADAGLRTLTGLAYGVGGVLGAFIGQHAPPGEVDSEAWKARATRDIVAMTQVALPEAVHPAGLVDTLAEVYRLKQITAPYAEAGKVPPVGLHPVIDEIHKAQNEHDLKVLDEIFKEAQKSKTRERNPEIFAKFIRQHSDANIGISGERVAELYGDKVPHPDDGLLGFVPDLAQQLEEAKATGGDVRVPLADWVSKVDPELAKELHDDIRVRPEGITKNEAKELEEQKTNVPEETKAKEPLYHEDAYDPETHKADLSVIPKVKQYVEDALAEKGLKVGDEVEVPQKESQKATTFSWLRPEKGERIKGTLVQTPNDVFQPTSAIVTVKLDDGYNYSYHVDQVDRPGTFKPIDERQAVVDSVRKAAGLNLAESRDIRKLKLERNKEFGQTELAKLFREHEGTPHDFNIVDEAGKEHGFVTLRELPDKKTLHVEYIAANPEYIKDTGTQSNAFGFRLTRDLLRQLKEEFPEAKTVEGIRVSGAREKGVEESGGKFPKVSINLAEEATWPRGWETAPADFEGMTSKGIREGGEPFKYREGVAQPLFTHKLTDLLDEVATPARGAATSIYALLRPKFKEFLKDVEVVVLKQEDLDKLITQEAPERKGMRTPGFYDPRSHKIVVSDDLMSGEWGRTVADKVIFHEAAHAFTEHVLLADKDMRDAVKLIMKEVDESISSTLPDVRAKLKYGFSSPSEFVAEAFSNPHFQELLAGTPISEGLAKTLGLGHGKWTLWDAFRQAIKQVMERLVGYKLENSAIDAMLKMGQYFEERQKDVLPYRQALKERYQLRAAESQPELPGMTRMEDRKPFERAMAMGMSEANYARWKKLFDQRRVEDLEKINARALKQQKQKLTKEWKEAEVLERPGAADAVNARPDVLADSTLRDTKTTIDPQFLTDEQKAALPKDLQGKDGVNPDDIAGLFGYRTGKEMVDHLVAYNTQRKAANLRPEEFKRRLIQQELDRRMEQKFGNLEEKILEEAKDQVLSETQLDLLHEETLAAATKANAEFSITKDQMREGVQKIFNDTLVRNIDSDKYLANAGRTGKKAEEALLKEDYSDYFKLKQQQYIATMMATEAKKLEKLQRSFEKTAKRFSKREVAGIPPEYTNFIHDVLMRTGNPVRRSVQDLQEAIGFSGFKDLSEFVTSKEGDLREMPIAEFLLDPNFRKKVEDMTANEFRALKDSVDTLVHNGRDESKLEKAGEQAELADILSKMSGQLQQFAEKHYDAEGKRISKATPGEVGKVLRTWGVWHLQMESVFNHLDKGDRRGVFTQYVMRPLIEGANYEAKLERDFAKKLDEVAQATAKDKTNLKEVVPNSLIMHPDTGAPMQLTRKNLRAIMLNFGNDFGPQSNAEKFAKGYKVDKEAVKIWLWQNATKADWDWAQGIWDIFADIKKMSDTMYRQLSGVAPENIPIHPFQTPHGVYRGGYYPLIKHPTFEGGPAKMLGPKALEQDNYFRATTPNSYTKQRTGAVYPLALDLDMMPVKMRQMLHDIAMRPAVVNASKVFYNNDFRKDMRRFFGKETADELIPYLRDVANSSNFMDANQSFMVRTWEVLRQNAIGVLIGWNPGTVLKHGTTALVNSITEVGGKEFLKATKGLFSVNEKTGDRNWTFAMNSSEELQRRHKHYEETLFGSHAANTLQQSTIRQQLMHWQSKPVAFFDLLSAVPTWMAEYEKSMKSGATHGDAVFNADRAVRRAHGSMAVTSQPGVVRKGGPFIRSFTSLYGFFNHVMNRQYEMVWEAGDAAGLTKGSKADFTKAGQVLTIGLTSYVILPALIEELVTPLPADQNESWTKKSAKSLAFTLSASWIGVRDIVSAALREQDPSAGLISTQYHAIHNLVRDFKKGKEMFNRANRGKALQDGITLLGMITGMFPAQFGKSARFVHDVNTGAQPKPKGPWGWLVGLRYGTLDKHSKTFNEWLHHH